MLMGLIIHAQLFYDRGYNRCKICFDSNIVNIIVGWILLAFIFFNIFFHNDFRKERRCLL